MLRHLNQYLFRVLQLPFEVLAHIYFVWKVSWLREGMGELQSQKRGQKMSDLALTGIISQCFSASSTMTPI